MNAPFTVSMTREQLEAHREACAKAGFTLDGDHGDVENIPVPFGTMGLKFDYDEAKQQLTLQVTHKPLVDPESKVEAEIIKDLTT